MAQCLNGTGTTNGKRQQFQRSLHNHGRQWERLLLRDDQWRRCEHRIAQAKLAKDVRHQQQWLLRFHRIVRSDFGGDIQQPPGGQYSASTGLPAIGLETV